jgi:hypothetical protein
MLVRLNVSRMTVSKRILKVPRGLISFVSELGEVKLGATMHAY